MLNYASPITGIRSPSLIVRYKSIYTNSRVVDTFLASADKYRQHNYCLQVTISATYISILTHLVSGTVKSVAIERLPYSIPELPITFNTIVEHWALKLEPFSQ